MVNVFAVAPVMPLIGALDASGTIWLVLAVILIVSLALEYLLPYVDSTDVPGGPAGPSSP